MIRSDWRCWLLGEPVFVAFVLLLPVLLLPPLPIDETRYLAVAWEMRGGGDWLVPHINGELYSQKPPLLFWLINAGWSITGFNGWSPRLVTLGCSLLSLGLLRHIALRLGATPDAARSAQWVLLGIGHFAVFANAIMFDVLLTTWVLVSIAGVLDLAAARYRRGIAIAGLGIGLGVLTKGPVVLLDMGFAALTAPWWSEPARAAKGRYFVALGGAVLLGAAIGLAWAIPAAIAGGEAYANAIFLKQTIGRVTASFAHQRPFWWYLWLVPLMLMPWLLALRGNVRSVVRLIGSTPVLRFAACWVLPTIAAFSLVSGKQGHYLLPILPGFALLFGVLIANGQLRSRSGLVGVALVLLGLVFATLPWLARQRPEWELLVTLSPGWGIAMTAGGIALIAWRDRLVDVRWPALTTLLVVLLVKLAIVEGTEQHYDPRPAAAEVRKLQDAGVPVIHYGWHHGVYAFAGRLREPLPWRYHGNEIRDWLREHPDGYVIGFERKLRVPAEPIVALPFRGSQFEIWTAAVALAAGVPDRAGEAPSDDED